MRDIEGIEKVLQVLEPHWREVHADFDRHNQRFLQLADANHDRIGRVLRAHLVVESFLNTFLSAHYGISDLKEAKLSFFQKAKLLPDAASSTAFVKPGILQLNAIRNKFGHNLDFEIHHKEISAINEVLAVARSATRFNSPVDAIEAFCPVACAFLSVPPPHLEKLFMKAFAYVHTRSTE
jgi:hypothetical protein